MAVGMTFVLIAGEVDLSVGSTYAFAGLATGMLIVDGWPLVPALGVGVLAGMVIGLVNGLLVHPWPAASLIATLGMLSIVRGAALILHQWSAASPSTCATAPLPAVLDAFSYMGQGYLFGVVPMQLVFFFALVAAIAWFVLSCTNFGFRVFAVGGSAKAARVSGIRVDAVKIIGLRGHGRARRLRRHPQPRLPAERPGRPHRPRPEA